jgi:hypothetical protein
MWPLSQRSARSVFIARRSVSFFVVACSFCVQVCGDMVFTSTMYQAVLPLVLWCAHHQDAEISAIARFASMGAAPCRVRVADLKAMSAIEMQYANANHVRASNACACVTNANEAP